MSSPIIAVLAGGTSPEREVSLGSGRAVAQAMACSHLTRLFTVDHDALPEGLDPARHVVFSTLHGVFGEDGGMQRLLDAGGFSYGGCDAKASDLCFDKWRTRLSVSAMGVPVAPGRHFLAAGKPTAAALATELGQQVVLKPNRQGSSVGLQIVSSQVGLEIALGGIRAGDWVAERRILGREITVGLLRGRAMGIVEVVPKSGVYDYSSKYTKGLTEYLAPARLSDEMATRVRATAETAFAACGCRDYARIDFMISQEGELYLLEINTLPGMKDTSLLPMSARCVGLDFVALCRELVAPAVERFQPAAARP
ncbi:D-alanine--D-alanine ligase [Lacunisphaera limnophila]|uniref:D-alanine--D-alanine ligase n=1 Tax=Lacunisphaera limnophila TaxID=1838286 RepID=A0A1D8AZW8_9BACT|nr:D-alanine--D-alanine ligase [Lacunisphaera limnophila]AOS46404.1 D-alanine--D-alanine ligase [Lacunisphaera limnophila]